jgi:hypothetical protein
VASSALETLFGRRSAEGGNVTMGVGLRAWFTGLPYLGVWAITGIGQKNRDLMGVWWGYNGDKTKKLGQLKVKPTIMGM